MFAFYPQLLFLCPPPSLPPIRQPLVPVMNVESGEWLLSDQLQPMTKPGGHGAIWKLMKDEGVFAWLKQQVGGGGFAPG